MGETPGGDGNHPMQIEGHSSTRLGGPGAQDRREGHYWTGYVSSVPDLCQEDLVWALIAACSGVWDP